MNVIRNSSSSHLRCTSIYFRSPPYSVSMYLIFHLFNLFGFLQTKSHHSHTCKILFCWKYHAVYLVLKEIWKVLLQKFSGEVLMKYAFSFAFSLCLVLPQWPLLNILIITAFALRRSKKHFFVNAISSREKVAHTKLRKLSSLKFHLWSSFIFNMGYKTGIKCM